MHDLSGIFASPSLVRNLLLQLDEETIMLASALVAYIFGPALGFAFALVVGSICGWTFALSVTGRAHELERRTLLRLGPLVDRILAHVVVPMRKTIAKATRKQVKIDPDAVIELGDVDLELGTNP